MSLKERKYENWFWHLHVGGMTFVFISREFPQEFNLP